MRNCLMPIPRPAGVSALSAFFLFGATMAGVAGLSLALPGGFMEPLWMINPRGRAGLGALGVAGIVLMATVSTACLAAAIGLWRGRNWGRRAAMIIVVVNAAGDLLNVWLAHDPRTLIGLPIAGAMPFYLCLARVRAFFAGRVD